MAGIEIFNSTTQEWELTDAKDAETVDGKHASGTLQTTAQDNLVDAINELKNNDISMIISMGGMV